MLPKYYIALLTHFLYNGYFNLVNSEGDEDIPGIKDLQDLDTGFWNRIRYP